MGQNELQAVKLEMLMGELEIGAGCERCALSCSITWHRKLICEVVCWGSNACLSARVTWRTQLQSGGDLMIPPNSAQVETTLADSDVSAVFLNTTGLRSHVGQAPCCMFVVAFALD
jgi:hypothetical protein